MATESVLAELFVGGSDVDGKERARNLADESTK